MGNPGVSIGADDGRGKETWIRLLLSSIIVVARLVIKAGAKITLR